MTDKRNQKINWKHALGFPLLVYAVSRLVTFAVVGILTIIEPSRSFLGLLSYWDGGWYLRIAEQGYPSELGSKQSELAYFPGYPLAVKAVYAVTGLPPVIVGVLTSLVTAAAAIVVIWLLTERLLDRSSADRAVAVISFFPSAFVFSLVYTEGLYTLLAATCLFALLRKQWLVAGLASGLASATRLNGLVLAASCLLAALIAIRRDKEWRSLVAPVLGPLGAVAFFSFLYARTGEALAPILSVQRGWDQRLDGGVATARGIARFVSTLEFADAQKILPVLMVGAFVLGVFLILHWRPPLPIAFYTLVSLALIVASRQIYSGPRYLLGAFPAMIAGAKLLSDRYTPLLIGASGALMAALFVLTGVTNLAP